MVRSARLVRQFTLHQLLSFNSTMVRSALNGSSIHASPICSFNSTMVRSAQTLASPTITGTVTFQFHDGSISTSWAAGYIIVKYICFNSTMVRSALNTRLQPAIPSTFQFHDGSISTLGRSRRSRASGVFQFHDGSISTRADRWQPTGNSPFQFHDGSISTLIPGTTQRRQRVFQFHDGSISTMYSLFVVLVTMLVSIPRWFDQHSSAAAGLGLID